MLKKFFKAKAIGILLLGIGSLSVSLTYAGTNPKVRKFELWQGPYVLRFSRNEDGDWTTDLPSCPITFKSGPFGGPYPDTGDCFTVFYTNTDKVDWPWGLVGGELKHYLKLKDDKGEKHTVLKFRFTSKYEGEKYYDTMWHKGIRYYIYDLKGYKFEGYDRKGKRVEVDFRFVDDLDKGPYISKEHRAQKLSSPGYFEIIKAEF
jgi:hypothetical protein